MAESKYGKYICTELKPNVNLPDFKGDQVIVGQGYENGVRRSLEHVIWMDGGVVPGAFYTEITWCWPTIENLTREEALNKPAVPPHSHPFDEIIGYLGTNMDDPQDLGAEIEFWLEDEQFYLTKSFIVYIPTNMQHCPLRHIWAERPMFHFTMGPGQKYT